MAMVIGLLGFFCILFSLSGTVVGLIRPQLLKRKNGEIPTRKQVLKYGVISFVAANVMVAIGVASDDKAKPAVPQQATAKTDASVSANTSKVEPVSSNEDAKKKDEVSDTECRANAECAFKRYDLGARSSCNVAVARQGEERAKYQVKFDDSMFSHPFFDKSGFKAGQVKGTHSLIYSGNRALFQNGFGAWQRTRYYCAYNMDLKSVEQVRFDES
jgi:hypothetical protein